MRAKSLTVGLSLAAAGVVTPLAALAQAPAAPAPAAPAPAAPAPAAPAPAAPGGAAPAPAAPAAEAPAAPAPATPPAAAPVPEQTPATGEPAAPVPAAAPSAPEPAPAETPPPLAVITGYVEGAYHMNLSKMSYDYTVPLRTYDAMGGNSFLLHAAHVGIAHSFGPEASVFVSLDFGTDASVNNAGYMPGAPATTTSTGVNVTPANPGTPPAVPATPEVRAQSFGLPVDAREAFAQWTPGDFMLKGGKFVTLNGIEVVDGPLNPTITRGYLFTLAEPVTHTGVKAQYAIGGIAHVGAGIVNGWDNIVDTNNAKTILFNADVAPAPIFRAQISGSYGSEQANIDDAGRLTVDLTGAVILDTLTLNFQGLIGSEKNAVDSDGNGVKDASDSWFGFGLQPVYTMDMFSIGGRLEYFSNKHGTRTGLANPFSGVAGEDVSLFNFTITPGITPAKNFTLRAEYRVDAVLGAKTPPDATGAQTDVKEQLNGKSSQHTIAIGAHYAF